MFMTSSGHHQKNVWTSEEINHALGGNLVLDINQLSVLRITQQHIVSNQAHIFQMSQFILQIFFFLFIKM